MPRVATMTRLSQVYLRERDQAFVELFGASRGSGRARQPDVIAPMPRPHG